MAEIPSEEAIRVLHNELSRKLDNDFIRGMYDSTYLSIDEYIKRLDDRYHYYEIVDSGRGTTEMKGVCQMYENYYDLINSLTFVLKESMLGDKPVPLPDKERVVRLFNQLKESEYEGVIVNTDPYCLARVNKTVYTVEQVSTGKVHDVYALTITIAENDKVKSASYFIVPDLYPKLFTLPEGIYLTFNTMAVNIRDKDENGISTGGTLSTEWAILSKGVRQNGLGCNLYIDSYISTLLLCMDHFFNRKRVYTKGKEQKKSDKFGISAKVSVGSGRHSKRERFVSLGDIVLHERSTGTRLGGHHASPREHIRSGHWRHYKSGKKVYIESVTVNKGKDKVIYKV